MPEPGVLELVAALRELCDRFPLESVSVTHRLPNETLLTVTLVDDILTFSDDKGNLFYAPQVLLP